MAFKRFKIDPMMGAVILDASVVGLHMVTHTLVGGGIGYGLDWWLGTKPTLSIIFLLLGIIAGFIAVYRDMKRILRKMEAASERETRRGEKSADETSSGSGNDKK